MLQTKVFEDHTQQYDKWYENNPEIYQSELLAIKEQLLKMPTNIHGIEVGLGTGRFAVPLGIKEGIEPAKNMRELAIKRGIEVMNARAEHLPYKALHFDFVLFVTICHLNDVRLALREAHKVLKIGGSVIIGFLEASGEVAKEYNQRRADSTFYKNAHFYTVDKMIQLLKNEGFHNLDLVQTLFGKLQEIKETQSPLPGFDKGSFIVIKAERK